MRPSLFGKALETGLKGLKHIGPVSDVSRATFNVKEAYEKLGADKVRDLKYHQANIKRELVKTAHETADTKIFLLLKDKLTVGTAIPKKEIRHILQGIYDYLKLSKKAKATDLNT